METVLKVARYICFQANLLGIILSKARLVKIIYLVDWKSAVDNGHQITNIEWYFNHYGPYVKEIIKKIENSDLFTKRNYINLFGNSAEEITLKSNIDHNEALNLINEADRRIIDYVLSVTKNMGYTDFLRLVYSTYPVLKTNKFEKMDLLKLAEEYKNKGNP